MQFSWGDIEVWAVICFLCQVWTVSAGRKGSLTNDYATRGGVDGLLSQSLRQQYTTSHSTIHLNESSDYYQNGSYKDDAVLSFSLFFFQKRGFLCFLIFLPRHSKVIWQSKKPVCVTFCLRSGCTEELLFTGFASPPNIYMCSHNCAA